MSAPPEEIIKAAIRGDVNTLRDWFATGNRDANAVFDFTDWEQTEDSEDDEEDEHTGTLLHCVLLRDPTCRSDATDAVRLLLENGADANFKINQNQNSPIGWCEFPQEMSVLIDAGADMNTLPDTPIIVRHHGLALAKLALRRGVPWDLKKNVWKGIVNGSYDTHLAGNAEQPKTVKDFIYEFTAAGSWKAYARQPRVELVRLRSLCARGRATPPPELERLFDCPSSATTEKPKAARAARPLPNEVFWHVLSFWRSSRDD